MGRDVTSSASACLLLWECPGMASTRVLFAPRAAGSPVSPCSQVCPGLQVRAQGSVLWLGYCSIHRARACVSL